MLLQISEPGQTPEPHARKLAVGIDLGTTNSLVASVRSGSAETLPDAEGKHLLPSVVRYLNDRLEVGYAARAQAAQDPHNTIVSVKRLMGRGVADVKTLGDTLPYRFVDKAGMAAIETCQGQKSPVEVSADILKALSLRAQQTLGGELEGVVITVPAYFDDGQRQATKDAAQLAGLNVLRLLNEPTAAAVAYGLDQQAEGVIAVYDLGGGTFDISILRLTQGVFEVLSTGGDSALGGDDFDHVIADWMLQQSGRDAAALTASESRELMMSACAAKEALTDSDSVSVAFAQWQAELTRAQMNELIDPLVSRTIRACKRALRDAGVKVDAVHDVVMVGGSTRVLHVRERVAEFLGREPLIDIDPDRVVAVGAAQQADVLVGNKSDNELLLLDVTPLSLGLETMGGLMEKVIHRNTTIPVARAQEFTTYKDGQTAMAIHVLQGERELIKDNRSLARFVLQGLPALAAGAAKIRVSFQVDADGLLSVSAKELSTGVESSIQVKPSYGLGDEEVARMLQDSYSHAREDMDARNLAEQQVDADRLIEALQAALADDGVQLLSDVEFIALEGEITKLQQLRDGDDFQAIEAGIAVLAKASDDFAARRMDHSIRQGLSGQRIDELEG